MNTLQAVLDTIENANLPEGTYLDLCNKLKTLSQQLKPENNTDNFVPLTGSNIITWLKLWNYFPNEDLDTFWATLTDNQKIPFNSRYNYMRDELCPSLQTCEWIKSVYNWDYYNKEQYEEQFGTGPLRSPHFEFITQKILQHKIELLQVNMKYFKTLFEECYYPDNHHAPRFVKECFRICSPFLTDSAIIEVTTNVNYRTAILKNLINEKRHIMSWYLNDMKGTFNNNTFGDTLKYVFTNKTVIKQYKNKTVITTIDKEKYYEVKIKYFIEKGLLHNYNKDYEIEFTTYTKKHKLGYDSRLRNHLLNMLYHYLACHTDYMPSITLQYNTDSCHISPMILVKSGIGIDKPNKRKYAEKLYTRAGKATMSYVEIEYQN
jgi:hypothetical protein